MADNCEQEPTYEFFYRSTSSNKKGFQPLPDINNLPNNIAKTTTDSGETLSFIVRVETGYQDRDQYQIAVRYKISEGWTAIKPQSQFNHRVLVNHGFSCGVDYSSGTAPSVLSYEPIGAITGALGDLGDIIPKTGAINVANNLDSVAIIDCRGPDPGFFHDSYRAFDASNQAFAPVTSVKQHNNKLFLGSLTEKQFAVYSLTGSGTNQ
ncbi:MAG: DUF6351 family protein [Venatoribacter sp.]